MSNLDMAVIWMFIIAFFTWILRLGFNNDAHAGKQPEGLIFFILGIALAVFVILGIIFLMVAVKTG